MYLPSLATAAALLFLRLASAQEEVTGPITGIPTPTAVPLPSTDGPPRSLAQTSYTYSYTYTTATTAWQAPSFATPRQLPPCTDAVCPAYGGAVCVDAAGSLYGVICGTRLGGIVIVDSGKKERRDEEAGDEGVGEGGEGGEIDRRSYTGSFAGCTGFCDGYNATYCVGVSYERGACMAFDHVTGNFPGPGFAGVRLS